VGNAANAAGNAADAAHGEGNAEGQFGAPGTAPRNLNLPLGAHPPPGRAMLTAVQVVLLGEDADAQACVAVALPPVALGRLRRTCRGARGAVPVGVDWAQLY